MNLDARIEALNDWHSVLVDVCKNLKKFEADRICERAGISDTNPWKWRAKKGTPNLLTLLLFINTANEYIKNRDKFKNNLEGVEL